jgi:hypothetical protein
LGKKTCFFKKDGEKFPVQHKIGGYRMKNNNDDEQKLSFSDSWKQPVAEIALGSSVIAAGVYLGAKGDASLVYQSLAKSGQNIKNRLDKHLNRTLSPVPRFFKNVIVKATPSVFRSIKNQSNPAFTASTLSDHLQESLHKLDENKVLGDAKTKFDKAYEDARFRHSLRDDPEQFDFRGTAQEFVNATKREELYKIFNPESASNNRHSNKGQNRNGRPGFGINPADIVSGALWGAGISAWHAVDNKINPRQSYKNKDIAFQISGSKFSSKTDKRNKGGGRMNQQRRKKNRFIDKNAGSGTTAAYDSLSALLGRIPQSATWGLGMTGVTLGTAALLKDHPELLNRNNLATALNNEQGSDKGQTNVIIVDPLSLTSLQDKHASEKIEKQANLLNRLKEFGQNVLGRHEEVRVLDNKINELTRNYHDDAMMILQQTGKTPEELIAEQFGQLVNESSEKDLFKGLINSEAHKLKQQDMLEKQRIIDDVKRDRLLTGLGLAGLAGGTGYAVYKSKNKEEGTNNAKA